LEGSALGVSVRFCEDFLAKLLGSSTGITGGDPPIWASSASVFLFKKPFSHEFMLGKQCEIYTDESIHRAAIFQPKSP